MGTARQIYTVCTMHWDRKAKIHVPCIGTERKRYMCHELGQEVRYTCAMHRDRKANIGVMHCDMQIYRRHALCHDMQMNGCHALCQDGKYICVIHWAMKCKYESVMHWDRATNIHVPCIGTESQR
jgi:hypothetical protein